MDVWTGKRTADELARMKMLSSHLIVDPQPTNLMPIGGNESSSHSQLGRLSGSRQADLQIKPVSSLLVVKSPPPTSQQEGSRGRSFPHQTGEGRITAYQWREHGAAKRDRRSQDRKKKLYLVNLFGFAAFWTRVEREANQKKKQAKAGETKN